jgi:LuxR family maltose regulon positive regulatory protein
MIQLEGRLGGNGLDRRMQQPSTAIGVGDLLTHRESEILYLLDERLSNKEIAQRLFITPETVQRHVSNMFAKLDVHNRRQAVHRARDLGILR